MIDFKTLYEKIRDVAFTTRRAIENSAAPGGHIERAKNVLYNNMDAIEAALKFASEAEKKIQILELELNDAESELDELTKKTTPKSKKKTPASDE